MPAMGAPLDEHHDLTSTERAVLAFVARGSTDAAIETGLEMTEAAVQSCLRRFRERTGLSGRALAVWAAKHEQCCIAEFA